MLEIERKFLMDGFPRGLELISEVDIEQGYISFDPEVRIRKAIDRKKQIEEYRITIKGNGDLTRSEMESEISGEFYHDTVAFLNVEMVKKDYKKYKLGPWELEVALVDAGTEWEFYYAEIEFPTEQDAKDFVVPAYFGEEITYNKDYKMKNYWKRTRG
ncbi:MAG: adenylate cyclase [Agathobacter sp.]|nr:adenylate cyclase [Agathobacter sp.]